MSDVVPAAVLARFGNRRARPRLRRAYRADIGWTDTASHPILTDGLVANLAEGGYSMVEARWRWKTHQISLTRAL